jgi:hypothetical protein
MNLYVKWLSVAALFLLSQPTRSELHTGTIILYTLANNELTVGADSRTVFGSTGQYVDTQCKIAAFGNKFLFSVSGLAQNGSHWNTTTIARDIWTAERKGHVSDSDGLVATVTDKWITEMESRLKTTDFISDIIVMHEDKSVPVAYVVNAMFAATDESRKLFIRTASIGVDWRSFSQANPVFVHDTTTVSDVRDGSLGYMGESEIASEFYFGRSDRARDYMNWFMPQIAKLPQSEKSARWIAKLVELSILLNRKRNLGFPIDVVQLQGGKGVQWVSRKPECPEN